MALAVLVAYQPQADAWRDFKLLTGRCAFALTPVRGRDLLYETFRFGGHTLVDADQKLVLLTSGRSTCASHLLPEERPQNGLS